jgi:zinc protease
VNQHGFLMLFRSKKVGATSRLSLSHASVTPRWFAWVVVAFATFAVSPRRAVAQGSSAPQTQQKPAAPAASAPAAQLVAQMPGAGPAKNYAFPPVATRTLANGIRVFVISSPAMPAISVRLLLTSAGSVNDPKAKPGIAAMTAALLNQGTAKRNAQQIAEAIDFVGGSLSANAGEDATDIDTTVVKKDFDLAMDLLSDITLHPNFRADELERQRQQLVSSLQVSYDDADYLASAAFQRIVFGDHPYGLPTEGTPGSANTMTRDDIVHFWDTYYSPGAALLAFSGDISPDAAFAAAEKYFGAWQSKTAPPAPPPASRVSAGVHITVIDKPDAVQTQIRVGKTGVRRNDPDFVPLYVADRVFGGSYNSRLNTEVRVKKGLTYGANSVFDTRMLAGSFEASTFTRTEATLEATQLIVDLMKSMATGNVKADELGFAQDYLVGVYPIQTETPDEVAARVLMVAHFDLPADYNQTYQARIAGITLEQVNAVASRYFDPTSLDIVLAGNASQFRDGLKKAFPSATYDEIPAAQLDLTQPNLRKYTETISPSTPETLAQGKELITAAAQAAGGDALAKVQSLEATASGRASVGGTEVPVEAKLYVIFPDRLRVDTKLPFGDVTQGYDGKNGWLGNPQGSQAVPPEMTAEFARSILLVGGVGLFRDALADKLQAQALGDRDLMGQKVLGVAITDGDLRVTVYLDPSTHLLMGARFNQETQQGKVEAVEIWSDFHDVQGMKFPFHSVTYRDGVKFSESTIQDVKTNTNPNPSLFVKPQ